MEDNVSLIVENFSAIILKMHLHVIIYRMLNLESWIMYKMHSIPDFI